MPTTFICTFYLQKSKEKCVDGSHDWMDYQNAEEASAKMNVPTKIIRVNDAGHQLYIDNPVEFNRFVAEECTKDI